MLRTNLVVKRATGRPKKNKISFVASTDSVDRYGDVINQSGWNVEAYQRNPVVLLNHNANSLPIGKGAVSVKDGQLMIEVEFDKDDEMAQRVERKARNGFLNAVSVGFNPIEAVQRSKLPKDHPAYTERGGNYFSKSELLEVSIVTIPANSEATTLSAKNISQIDRLTVRDLIAQELKHILEVEQMEDGKYRIVFAGEEQEEETEEEIEEEITDGYGVEEEEEEEADKEEAELEEEDSEEEEKGFLTNNERELLALILKS